MATVITELRAVRAAGAASSQGGVMVITYNLPFGEI